MKKSQKIILGVGAGVVALGVVAAIAGPMIYRDFIAAPAADVPTVTAPKNSGEAKTPEAKATAGQPLDAAKLSGTWEVAKGSEAGYRVEEVLNGTDVTVTGRTSGVTGTFTISADGLTLEAADLKVDVASIKTDSANRDDYFRDQALHTSQHPDATFKLTKPVTLAAVPNSGTAVTAEAAGDLTIAGVTKPVTFSVQVQSDGTTAQIAGSIPITFEDFGVTAPDLGFVKVEPKGQVEFQLNAAKQ